uniref:DUF727 domain-containing protein n=1 Tax=Syphacia muris TaxID=451379 RepID=A0A0N5AFH2_9BILA
MEEEKSLLREAEAAVEELAFAVSDIALSKKLRNSKLCVYVNLTTCENKDYCVELTSRGWRIVSLYHDNVSELTEDNGDEAVNHYYETMYQLLNALSPEYRRRFSSKIAAELERHLSSGT